MEHSAPFKTVLTSTGLWLENALAVTGLSSTQAEPLFAQRLWDWWDKARSYLVLCDVAMSCRRAV